MLKLFFKSLLYFSVSFFILNIPVSKQSKVFDFLSSKVSINYTKLFQDVKEKATSSFEQGKEYSKKIIKTNVRPIRSVEKLPSARESTKVHLDQYTDEERNFIKNLIDSN